MSDRVEGAPDSATPGKPAALDRSDSRVTHATGLGGTVRAFLDRVRSGDLGSLPVVVGLVIIWTVFTVLNPVFVSPNNLVNLLFDCSTVGVIALGIVCVLILGEIDLSVGSMSGVGSALVGVLWVNQGVPLILVIAAALAFGAAIGAVYALLRTRLGMPSFVSTLAGLLALLGLQLTMLGSKVSINLPYGSSFVGFGQLLIIPGWLSYALALIPGAVILVSGLRTNAQRREANLTAGSTAALALKAAVVTVALLAIVHYLERGRGVAVDVRPLRPARRGHELRLHPHEVGPLDVRGGRQRGGRAPRRHRRARHLRQRVHAVLGLRSAGAACCPRRGWPRRASRRARATSTSTRSRRP